MRNFIFILLTFFCFHNGVLFAQPWHNVVVSKVDKVFEKYLKSDDHISGGVVSIVEGDSIFMIKGYGMADLENKKPFDPSATVVQIASVTKLITTTAILQLAEQGKIKLNDPVSKYLGDDLIRNSFDKQVLIIHLLTHTAGFDDRATLMETSSQKNIIPLDVYNQKYLPKIVWQPGKFFNYSNYSFNLLAYLVQKVSGKKFEEYVSENILNPLEMKNSGFGYEPFLTNTLMKRYKLKANDMEETWSEFQPIKYTNIPGADDFKTTGNDMSNFLRMYLNGGSFKGRQILQRQTIENAFDTHFTYDKKMTIQQGLGWRIMFRDGIKYLYHNGDGTGIESSLVLFPGKGVGFFTAFNNQVGSDAKNEILDSIFNCLYPGQEKIPLNYQVFTPTKTLIGNYFYMNDGQATFEKIAYLLGDKKVTVSAKNDTLIIGESKYLEIAPLVFDRLNGEGKLVFIKNEDSETSYFSLGSSTYRKISNWENPTLHIFILFFSILIIIVTLLIGLIQFATGLVRKKLNQISSGAFWIYINLSMVVLFLLFLFLTTKTTKIGEEVPAMLKITLVFPLLALLFLPISVIKSIKIWKSELAPKWKKVLLSLGIFSVALILIILNQYNLVGYNFY